MSTYLHKGCHLLVTTEENSKMDILGKQNTPHDTVERGSNLQNHVGAPLTSRHQARAVEPSMFLMLTRRDSCLLKEVTSRPGEA